MIQDVINFIVIFIPVIFAFSLSFHILLGTYLYDFRSIAFSLYVSVRSAFSFFSLFSLSFFLPLSPSFSLFLPLSLPSLSLSLSLALSFHILLGTYLYDFR